TGRLSAFDVVMPTPIPDKGRVLTQLSLFWFELLKSVIPNHVLDAAEFPAPFHAYREQLAGRAMLVKKTQPLPIECVVRGYLSGSGWKEYQAEGKSAASRCPLACANRRNCPSRFSRPPQKPPPDTTEIFPSNALRKCSANPSPKRCAP